MKTKTVLMAACVAAAGVMTSCIGYETYTTGYDELWYNGYGNNYYNGYYGPMAPPPPPPHYHHHHHNRPPHYAPPHDGKPQPQPSTGTGASRPHRPAVPTTPSGGQRPGNNGLPTGGGSTYRSTQQPSVHPAPQQTPSTNTTTTNRGRK